ncbi:MAG: alpha/beta hydrolase [Deltaproteobacteria bacterium]|nr:alpha/beta hydrolase [Deltaproteobacteria bacterium]MBW2395508.1 alpha/beta hydrolase [Deltaproteobacteria bacterium]
MTGTLSVGFSLVLLLSGCIFIDVAQQHELSDRSVRLRGTIAGPTPEEGPLIALLVHWPEDGAKPEIVDHYVLVRTGEFYFSTTQPGTYSIPAFVDRNENLRFDPGEPAIASTAANTFVLAEGEAQRDIALEIGAEDRVPVDGPIDIRELQARSIEDQVGTTMGQLTVEGEIVDLADAKLGRENGDMGLWRPYDFIFQVGAGVYFLEPYDPARIPVLFIHGVGGIPQDFAYLIERLDRRRFQPWLYYYPSGAKLGNVAKHLSQTMAQLELEHGVERFFVVAHSMGGLVARAFLLHHSEAIGSDAAQLFVTFSTPWHGHAWAQLGVDLAPVAVHSWIDIAPESDFLRGLFYREGDTRRKLPDHLPHHMLFGFRRDDSLPGLCSDTVVSVASELRSEAQEEAVTIFGYDTDHVGILNREDAAARLNGFLAAAE